MSDTEKTKALDEYAFVQNLYKYLNTRIETSRGVVNVREERSGQLKPREERYRTVQYDCHDIRVTISNIAPTEPAYPLVVFTGVALVVKLKGNEEKAFKRWHDSHLPKVDLRKAPQHIEQAKQPPHNYFPSQGNRISEYDYFPIITGDEQRHGYFLFPSHSIVYETNVLLAECLYLSDIDISVEGTISRRHLFHFARDLTI